MSVTIIAECGVNHDGSLGKALRFCDAAREAGADVIKFQTFVPEKCIRKGNDYTLLDSLALSFSGTLKISQHCEALGIEFCSTPDDLDSLKFLVEECGVKRIKIGSGSLLYHPLVDAAFDTGLPVLLSTGMATLQDVFDALPHDGTKIHGSSTLMHCVSLYPCPLMLANVGAMLHLKTFGMLVGYSDHTKGTTAAMAAVALGAAVVEKHFTLDCRDVGPDHAMSTEPWEFADMVRDMKEMRCVIGHGRKEPCEEELAMIPSIRKDADGFQPGLCRERRR